MSARQDPTRREDLLFMLLHGGAASSSIAHRVVDNAVAEATAPLLAEVSRLREERHSTNEALDDAVRELRVQRDRIAELEAETYVAPAPSCTRCYGADAVRFVANGGATSPCRVCGPSETDLLRTRVTELEAAAEKVATFCAQRAEYVANLRDCQGGHDYDRWQGHAEARRQLSQLLGLPIAWPSEDTADADGMRPGECRLAERAVADLEATHWKRLGITPPPCQQEDPHDGPLHHDYALGHDLPEVTP